ncbi:MAG TPA: hypothetical protein VKX41_06140 [Alloacidobacterium sp.]|nr:hypothetical protein [Alloacidobacterium sp.]
MPYRRSLILSVLLLSCLAAVARNKKKVPLPVDILQAHTAWVIIDPQAGVDVTDPNANRIARSDVENALAKWGRLTPVTDPSQADIIIVVRKSSGRLVQPTIAGTPINSPPPVIAQRTDAGISASGRAGPPLDEQQPHPQTEVGNTQDTFAVYRGHPAYNNSAGNSDNPLDSPPVWRYTAKDALESPSVPAVDAFRKAVNDSEKALAGP